MNFQLRPLPTLVLACLLPALATRAVAAPAPQAAMVPRTPVAEPAASADPTAPPAGQDNAVDTAAPADQNGTATPVPPDTTMPDAANAGTPIAHPDAADLAPAPAPAAHAPPTPRKPLPPPSVRTPPGALPWYGVLFRVTPPSAPAAADTGAHATTADNATDAESAPDAAAASAAPTVVAPEDRASWILGTIHFGSDEEHGIDSARLQRLVDAASTVVNEVDVDAPVDAAMDAYRWLPPDQSLASMISAESLARARELLPGVDPASLERMKPWLLLALLEARGERTGDNTMDVRVQRMASADGLALVHLEDMATQLQALDCVPWQEQSRVLAERLRMPWLMQHESARALAFYHDGDLWAWLADVDRMDGLGDTAKAVEMHARRCLIEQRNAQWLPRLMALLAQGGSLVTVGAIHLPGYDGLLAALLRAGYRVEAQPL